MITNHFSCNSSVFENINYLNSIPSPTDQEQDLLIRIEKILKDNDIMTNRIEPKPFLNVSPVLVGNLDAKNIFVVHCDRIQENPEPLHFNGSQSQFANGKLDNTVSLSVCLHLFLASKPQKSSLLITTSEEGKYSNTTEDLGPIAQKGGRGFISFLKDYRFKIRNSNFICVDVRPINKNDVYISPGNLMKLGDGLVLRTREKRGKVNLLADLNLLDFIRNCMKENDVNFVEFDGGGTTELGRGWEMELFPTGFPQNDFHVAWIQPPISDYHTTHEKMAKNDILSLFKVIENLISKFEDAN